jgi:hypothetical protein
LQARKFGAISNQEFPASNTSNAALSFINIFPPHSPHTHHKAAINKMCLTVKYLCPCSGEESGKSDAWARRHDPCVNHLFPGFHSGHEGGAFQGLVLCHRGLQVQQGEAGGLGLGDTRHRFTKQLQPAAPETSSNGVPPGQRTVRAGFPGLVGGGV